MVLNEKQIQTNLNQVLGWEYRNDYLTKTYKLADFKASLTFVNNVGELAEEADHHPDIVIQYNKVTLSVRTHDEDGITNKDFSLAEKIEKL
ncbi:4a-hydroxytetrahydrobiopterin dehydratase [Virgibacillus natechei]|uniref:4a-hydroxytetrahydrobiopterin dehydratase n=1 Tax=Virgibacillus natechei TaxID=1216297 RepID=A0ABS4IH78_9BACI|nr:4a-hydroxytetrahydrobiopterin dehydratase [Virgibacillus natechei]MBP1969791.1 4a-hydroxytetrahydrobiopterin dehydratase [Virgibacillus natechei]UZD12672.1 4a-hydroxytetrahydrobiopterin dehydratase [Virgibacillus natechei]